MEIDGQEKHRVEEYLYLGPLASFENRQKIKSITESLLVHEPVNGDGA